MTIARKLHTTTVISLVAIGATSLGLLLGVRQLNFDHDVQDDLHVQLACASELATLTAHVMSSLTIAIDTGSESDAAAVLARAEDLQGALAALIEAIRHRPNPVRPTLAADVEPHIETIRQKAVLCIALLRQGEPQAADEQLAILRGLVGPVEESLADFIHTKKMHAEGAGERLDRFQELVAHGAAATLIAMTLLIAVVNTMVGRSITRPLARLRESTRRLAAGDWSVELDATGRDELSEVAAAFNEMVEIRRSYNEELEAQRRYLEEQRQDLTDLNRQLEAATAEAKAANCAKSDFLANMSHEIRTPMTAILGFADVILEEQQNRPHHPEWFQAIRIIKANGEHLLNLINDILDLSKIEAGKMKVEVLDCSPCQIIADVASLVSVRADAAGLSFRIEYAGPIPETIQTDPTRLRQILINLIGNAIKFTGSGGVKLITELVPHQDDAVLQFDVIDTGIGMSPAQTTRLFEAFTQADTSITRNYGGTGLGLTISKRLAEALGGDLTLVKTCEGQGSHFRFTVSAGARAGLKLIADPLAATTVTIESTAAPTAGAALEGCRVLLAEDGPDNQRLIALVLHKAGAEVTVKENGQLAVEAALQARDRGNAFDVILMDMQMPVMDQFCPGFRILDLNTILTCASVVHMFFYEQWDASDTTGRCPRSLCPGPRIRSSAPVFCGRSKSNSGNSTGSRSTAIETCSLITWLWPI